MNEVQGLGLNMTASRPAGRASKARVVVVISALVLAGSLFSGTSGAAPAKIQDGTDATNIACSLTAEANSDDVAAAPDETTPTVFASPEATGATATGQPADAATTAEITLLVRTLAACLSDGQNETVAALVTQRYLGAVYGGGGELSRSDFLNLASQLPTIPMTVVSVSDVRLDDSRTANADVVTIVGNQLDHGRWNFVLQPAVKLASTNEATNAASPEAPDSTQPDERWLVNGVVALAVDVPADATPIKVDLDEYSFKMSPVRTTAKTIVLNGTNRGDEEHEMLLVRLDDGVTSGALIRKPGPGLPDGMTFMGQQTIAPGAQGQLVLVDLEPGTYVLVCLLPDSDGTPHIALGMHRLLRIDAD